MSAAIHRKIAYISLFGAALLEACTSLAPLTEADGLDEISIVNQAIPTELLNGNASSTGRGISFGEAQINEAVDITLPINNYTNIDASLLTATVPGGVLTFTGGGAYPGTGGTCTDTLVAGATCAIALTFTPTMQQDYYLTPGNGLIITFAWNGQNNTMNVPVIGRCSGAAACTQALCTGSCPDTDINNCGACGNVCGGESPSCSSGVCSCNWSELVCNNQCANPTYDPNNCGTCGNVCPGGGTASCSNGSCSFMDVDVNNCGSYRNACGGTTPNCTGGTCYDLASDHDHCGSFGNACGVMADCVAGSCAGAPSGAGTAMSPYLIATASDFKRVGRDTSAHYQVTADIDLTNLATEPIQVFSGVFDGNHHTISHWHRISNNNYNYIGVFAQIWGGTVKDLTLTSVTAHGDGLIGGLAGQADSATVSGCSAQGSISGDDDVGGLIGLVSNASTISKSFSSASVSSGGYAGGLVGVIGAGCTISDSYATGAIIGANGSGGLVGYNQGNVSRAFSTGAVSGSGTLAGLVATVQSGTYTNTYWDTQTSGQSSSARGTGKTTAQMQTQSTFNGFDFTTVWQISAGQYPTLR